MNNDLSEAKRQLLEKYLRQGSAPESRTEDTILRRPHRERAPLSLSQEQLWLRETSFPGIPPLYNECVTIRMAGPLDGSALERSLLEIVRRHEIWRTSYAADTASAFQVIHAAPQELHLPVVDLRNRSVASREADARHEVEDLVRERFDLQAGPLLRFKLIRTHDFEHRLLLCAHLSIVDGVSAYQVFPKELAALYSAFLSGENSPLPPLPIQFADYAYWQRSPLQEKTRTHQRQYWKEQLAGPTPLDWPKGRLGLPSKPFAGKIHQFAFTQSASRALEYLAQKEGVTPFTSLAASFAAILHCYTRQDDIIIGTPSPCGRKRSEAQNLLGHFLNPVALRFDLSDDLGFHELLLRTQRMILDALSNDDVPLEALAEEIQPATDAGRHPFFNAAISLQPPSPRLDLDWSVTSMDVDSGGAPWEFYIAFISHPIGLIGRVQYNPDLFEEEVVHHLLEDFQGVLEFMSANPSQRLSQMELRSSSRHIGVGIAR